MINFSIKEHLYENLCGEENGYRVHLHYVEMLGFVFNLILTY
jgi:hypothetical protein